METFFSNLNMPSLSQDLRHSLEAPITQKEIVAAITPMQSGKYPGPEGLPSDFFKKFSDSFDSGKLPSSFYQACISLLLKKDKDPLDCASYRQISLLNTDLKILAKILAHRLEDVLSYPLTKPGL